MVIVVVEASSIGSRQDSQVARRNMERCVELARTSGVEEVAIASSGQVPTLSNIGLISFSDRYPLGQAVADYLRDKSDTHVTLISAELPSLSAAGSALRSLIVSRGTLTFIPTLQGSIEIDFPGMTESGLIPSQLMQELQPEMTVPGVGLTVERSMLTNSTFSTQTLAGLSLELLLEAFHRGEAISRIQEELAVPMHFKGLTISSDDIARILRRAVESIPIEDLFPSYSWATMQEESAASCYHTLAARFIRLRDFANAESCLTQADQLHDSPRALALRAVIAMERGETLGAIAKMIASLQDYEQKKSPHGASPKGIEQVNEELRAGLQALNAQDNSGALKHFARAVRTFDSFYSDSGLLLLL